MRKLTFLMKAVLVVLISAITVIGASYIYILLTVPAEMILIEGENYFYNLGSILPISINTDTTGILKINGKWINPGIGLGLSKPVSLTPYKGGSVRLNLKFLGILPVRTVHVDVVSNKHLVACGNTVGVKLKLDGILVVGISDVESNGQRVVPVKNSGIKPGHVIMKVNGKTLNSIDDLINGIEKNGGKPLNITYRTSYGTAEAAVMPVKSDEDGKYHVGLWVRDSTAGIGTLTFYDAETGKFGALGHGITDVDTGTLMSIKSGEIVESSILGVKVGKSGDPGELKGIFSEGARLGTIEVNSEVGIYGKLDPAALRKIPLRSYPVGVRAEIKEGPATILSNIDGNKIEEYEILVQKVSRQNLNGTKGMIIKITDERLLKSTGGIVQGMSGSPIIQDGKIIGAVTHVLVNDPTRGYGIFIETMLKNTLL